MYLNLTDSIWFPKYCLLDATCVQRPQAELPVYLYIRKPEDRPAAVYHSATVFTSGGSTGKKSEKKAL